MKRLAAWRSQSSKSSEIPLALAMGRKGGANGVGRAFGVSCFVRTHETPGFSRGEKSFRMSDDLLEEYIVQQIEIAPEAVISFFWHGGEPTILGLDYFHKIVELQRKHQPPNR